MLIRHKETGKILLEWKADTLAEADLRHASLSHADLIGIDLSYAQLDHACLMNAQLQRANLEGACLAHASFSLADLTHANLRGAILRSANLRWVCLREADLTGAELVDTDLTGAWLAGVIFTRTVFWDTILADCQDLHKAIGLAETEHDGASTLDFRTLRANLHLLPRAFLEGIGLTAEEMAALATIYPKPEDAA